MDSNLSENHNDNRLLIESLRPHFVFNMMNILRYIIKKDANKACDMVYDLSIYMRCKLGSLEPAEYISFEEEWSVVQAYLRLEQISMPYLQFSEEVKNNSHVVKKGELLEIVEKLIKEQVRVTREKRTIYITDEEGRQSIKAMIKENGVCIQL